MSNLHNGPIGGPLFDFLNDRLFSDAVHSKPSADVIPISRKTVLPEFPESTDTKVISRAEYDRLVRGEKAGAEIGRLAADLVLLLEGRFSGDAPVQYVALVGALERFGYVDEGMNEAVRS